MKDLNSLIVEIRNEKVILDFDLAKLYGVSTRVLRQAVKRNKDRFPIDFMFRIDSKEVPTLMSQTVTLNSRTLTRGTPWAFTELGVAMLSTVLKGEKAIAINIMIMRIFVHLRKSIVENNDIRLKLSAMESELSNHSDQLSILFQQLDNLAKEDPISESKIGFKVD